MEYFGEEQIDLDVTAEVTKEFIRQTIKNMAAHGCSILRLDAFAYAIKKLDTNDFCRTGNLGFTG